MRQVHFKPQARNDLLEIWRYIAVDNATAADRFADEVERTIFGLAEFPGKGHRRADVKDERYRFWAVRAYIIAYYFDASAITVVRILHGRRNLRRIFHQWNSDLSQFRRRAQLDPVAGRVQ